MNSIQTVAVDSAVTVFVGMNGFLDEAYPLVEDEVKRQIVSMQALDA